MLDGESLGWERKRDIRVSRGDNSCGYRNECATRWLPNPDPANTSQIHYARAEVHELLNQTFVDVLRAKGVKDFKVALQVLLNAALPLVSLLFADLLAVLMLHVFVIESIFRIPGIGRLTLLAIDSRDLPVIMGITMVIVVVGIFGNLLQDLLAFVLDPRIRSGDE